MHFLSCQPKLRACRSHKSLSYCIVAILSSVVLIACAQPAPLATRPSQESAPTLRFSLTEWPPEHSFQLTLLTEQSFPHPANRRSIIDAVLQHPQAQQWEIIVKDIQEVMANVIIGEHAGSEPARWSAELPLLEGKQELVFVWANRRDHYTLNLSADKLEIIPDTISFTHADRQTRWRLSKHALWFVVFAYRDDPNNRSAPLPEHDKYITEVTHFFVDLKQLGAIDLELKDKGSYTHPEENIMPRQEPSDWPADLGRTVRYFEYEGPMGPIKLLVEQYRSRRIIDPLGSTWFVREIAP